MPRPTQIRGDDVPICPDCGKRHLTRYNTQACAGHVTTDRESYVKGQDRKKLPEPRPCQHPPAVGLAVCGHHGGRAAHAKAAGEKRAAEAKVTAAVLRRLGDAGDPVIDPISKLCAIAGRAVAFMEALGARVDQAEGEAADRADIAIYGRSIKDAAGVVESIIRMGIAERLAKVEEEQTAAIVKFIDGVLTDLGHNPRAPEVAGVVARRLELVS